MKHSFGGKLVARFGKERQGTIAIISAFMLPVLLGAAALAVDLAAAQLDRRTSQAIADLAAINAASNIGIAEEAAQATLKANGLSGLKALSVVKGHYTADAALAPAARFKAGQIPFNAVEVHLTKTTQLHFAHLFYRGTVQFSVSSLSSASAQATFSVGSRLAALRGGLINQVLGAMLGTNVGLSVMDYDALASAHVRIDELLGAINTSADLRAATYQDVLNSNVAVRDVASAAAAVLNASGDGSTAALMASLVNTTPGTLRLPLSTLIDAGPYANLRIGENAGGLAATLSTLDILQAAAMIANGEHQVALTIDAGIPGVAQLQGSLLIGERPKSTPWVSVGEAGATVSTAQTRLRLVAQIGGTGALAGLTIRLPLYVELANATATLKDVACSNDQGSPSATIAVTPGVGRVALTDLTDAQLADPPAVLPQAKLISAPLMSVTGSSILALQNLEPIDLSFSAEDVADQTIKRAATRDVIASAVTSLLGSADIRVKALGLGVSLTTPEQLVSALAPAASALDDVLYDLLLSLGVSLGEADVSVHGIRCGAANLAG